MNLWPWGRTERRESSYTDLIVAAAVARAGGALSAAATATGALQACSGMVARSFAAASVEGPDHLVKGVSPFVLSMVGRAMMRCGESVHVIDIDPDGDVRLLAVSHWDVQGDSPEDSWIYRVNLPGPSTTRTRLIPSAGVVHCRYECDQAQPWKGIGPLQSATLAGKLSAETISALSDGESGPRGNLLPLPVDGADPSITQLKADIRNLRGQTATVESVRSMHPGAAGNAPQDDWKPRRLGASPGAPEVELMMRAGLEVVAACGCAGMFDAQSATAAREAFKRFTFTTIQPLGRIVSAELSEKLGADVTLNFDALMAADVQARARAWRSLAGPEAKMTPEAAARLVGLAVTEP